MQSSVGTLFKDNMVALALPQRLAIFQGRGRCGSWWLVTPVSAPCAQPYVLGLEPLASWEQRLSLKGFSLSPSQSLEHLYSKQLLQENVCVPRKCEGRFMVFKIHELHEMERSFPEYRKETERLCLQDTQAVFHLRQKNVLKSMTQNDIDSFPPLSRKRCNFIFTF